MKIKVNRKSMKKCLDTVSLGLPNKSIIPINDNFLFVIEGQTCYAYAKNGKMQIKGQFAVESKGDFSMCVPGKTIMNTIGLLGDEEISLNYNDEKFILTITAGKKRYKLTGYNPKQFTPQSITSEGLNMSILSSKIIPQITTISKVVKWDDLRPQLAGLTIASVGNDITVSGAHESTFFCRSLIGVNPEQEFGIVLPRDISNALSQMRGAGDTEITIFDRSVFFSLDGFELQSTLLEVKKVINLEQLFCHEREEYIVIDREEMSMALKRLLNYSTENAIIRLDLQGTEFNLSCDNEDFGKEAEETIDVENHGSKDCIIGISIRHLSSILAAVSDEKIKMFMVNYKRPVFIQKHGTMDDSEVWGCAPMLLKEHTTKV